MERIFFAIGAMLAGLSVAAGAYGAHGGEALGVEQARWISKAARYQMYHSIALLAVSCAMVNWPRKARPFTVAGWLFLLGILLFSGSLYLMAFWGVDLGYVTPAGGFAFIGAWVIMSGATLSAGER